MLEKIKIQHKSRSVSSFGLTFFDETKYDVAILMSLLVVTMDYFTMRIYNTMSIVLHQL